MLAFGEVAGVLGLPPRERTAQSPVALITRIENGLPIAALDRVARLLAPGDAQFNPVSSPRPPMNAGRPPIGSGGRERASGQSRPSMGLALDVWKTEEATRAFLFCPHPMIEDRRPIDVVIRASLAQNWLSRFGSPEIRHGGVTAQILIVA